jgi:serine/threonine protein kinase
MTGPASAVDEIGERITSATQDPQLGPPPPDPRLGALVLGRYRLVRHLATGGMGAIYLARTEGAAGFVRPVVIKRLLQTSDDQAGRMFAREARILSQLRHPGIVSIHDFAEDAGDHLMVLDYVHGYTLSDWVNFLRRTQRMVPVDLATHVTLRVLEAMQYAHAMRDGSGEALGVVHRDVKPSNVLIDVQGDVKLADFGIARTDTEVSSSDTALMGTFPYMAPELFAHGKPSPVTDVYSAAVMLYSILRGANPFASSDMAVAVGRVLDHEPEPLHQLRRDASPALSAVIARGMHKSPGLRYASAEAFAAALRGAGAVDADVERRFRAEVASDFGDPSFAPLLGVPSLVERAEAWRREPRAASEAEPPPLAECRAVRDVATASVRSNVLRRSSLDADLAIGNIPDGTRRGRRRGARVTMVIAAVLGIAAAIVSSYLVPGETPPGAEVQAAKPVVIEPPVVDIARAPDIAVGVPVETFAEMRALPLTAGDRAAAVEVHRRALIAHRAQRYGDAEELWAEAARLDPSWEGPFYNLACIASLEGRVEDALVYLTLVQKRGISYSRLRKIETDPDLVAVRARPEVREIVDSAMRALLATTWTAATAAGVQPAAAAGCHVLTLRPDGTGVHECRERFVATGTWTYQDGALVFEVATTACRQAPCPAEGPRRAAIKRLVDGALCLAPVPDATHAALPDGCYRRNP